MVSLGLLRRILDLIASSWSLVLEICEHHKALWSAVRAYISFAMHPSLLMCLPHQMEEVLPVLKQVRVCVRACIRACVFIFTLVFMSVLPPLLLPFSLSPPHSLCVGGRAASNTWGDSIWALQPPCVSLLYTVDKSCQN